MQCAMQLEIVFQLHHHGLTDERFEELEEMLQERGGNRERRQQGVAERGRSRRKDE